jgi:hypothetical protein
MQGTDSVRAAPFWELPPLLVFTLCRFIDVHDIHGTFLFASKVSVAPRTSVGRLLACAVAV